MQKNPNNSKPALGNSAAIEAERKAQVQNSTRVDKKG